MNDEERRKLCAALKLQGRANPSWGQNVSLEAAEEIERLEQEFEATVDSKEQRALKAEMRCLALEEEIEYLNRRLAQSDAEPWRCPIGIPPESHSICSAGTCWWCLADRVKAQSDAEPVAWLVHSDRGMNFATVDKPSANLYAERHPNYSVEPLYTAPLPVIQTEFNLEDGLHELAFPTPPRPDASAGLIEAAEIADEQANEWCVNDDIYFAFQEFAKELRSRAADRSGK